MEKKQMIRLGDLTLTIKTEMFDVEELDLDSLVRIDSANLAAEVATFPIVLNRISWLVAEASDLVNSRELELRVFEAKFKKIAREEFEGKNMSNEKADEAVRSSPQYFVKKKLLQAAVKQQEILSGLYWSAKSKNDLLTRLVSGMSSEDFAFSVSHLKRSSYNHVNISLIQTDEEE